jgi:hypothetical protein
MASIKSVEYKIFHAAQHIKSLAPELLGYFQKNPGKMVRLANTSDHEAYFVFEPQGPIPARFGLIIGDCLQNLRSSLDYLVWELVLAAGNHPGIHNMFPICGNVKSFQNAVLKKQRLQGVDSNAIAQIEAFQPYHLGPDFNKSILWTLNELTNINKHRRILLTNLMAGPAQRENIVEKEGEIWYHTGPGPTPVFDEKTKFGPFPIIQGQVHFDIQLVAIMAFGEGPAKGMEVSLCMTEWLHYVRERVMPAFEGYFAK